MKKLLLFLLPAIAWAENEVPKDIYNTPIYSGTGKPVFAESTELLDNSWSILLTLPTTGENYHRSWKHIAVRNPDAARSVYVCLGNSSSCSTKMIKIPGGFGFVLDDLYFGPLNSVTAIWGSLDDTGDVTPEVTVW